MARHGETWKIMAKVAKNGKKWQNCEICHNLYRDIFLPGVLSQCLVPIANTADSDSAAQQ